MAPQDEIEKYRNGRYVRSVRVSNDAEQQNSDDAQLAYLKAWADDRQMVHVDDFVEPNLSGSLPGNRTDMEAILHRADTLGDFQYVLSQRIDRATRGGSDHLSWFRHELAMRGVTLLTPGDGLPEDITFSGTLRAAKADAAQETAMSTSQRTAQGSGLALAQRRISPHSRTPFGCYRLYCRSDGTPLYVIVDLRDGRQEKRSWPDLALIDTYGTIGGKATGHYKKQKSELVYLVPGDPRERETTQMMYRWHYLDGLSARKIAQRLNALGIRAPLGGKWAARQVASLLENEDYTAVGIANRRSGAFYNRRSPTGPIRVARDVKAMATQRRLKSKVLPRENWHVGDEPYLTDFLGDEDLRQIASAQQKRQWDRRLDPTWTRKNSKKHHVGPYLLFPLLKDSTHKESLVGSMSGTARHPQRVYRHKRGRDVSPGNIFNRTVNANALHPAILAVLRDVLLDWPELERRLRDHAERQIALAGEGETQLTEKRAQREEVADQLLLYVRMLTKKTREALAPEIARLEAQRDALDAEIEMIERQSKVGRLDPANVAGSLRSRIEALAEDLSELPVIQLNAVLTQLTDRLEVDMATKQVEFAFHVPAWMLDSAAKTPIANMCMRTSSGSSTGPHTQRDPMLFVPLAAGDCTFTRGKFAVTCECRRRPRIAA